MMLVCDITTQEETTKWTKESNDQAQNWCHKSPNTRILNYSLFNLAIFNRNIVEAQEFLHYVKSGGGSPLALYDHPSLSC